MDIDIVSCKNKKCAKIRSGEGGCLLEARNQRYDDDDGCYAIPVNAGNKQHEYQIGQKSIADGWMMDALFGERNMR
jgi:hypothetical protein